MYLSPPPNLCKTQKRRIPENNGIIPKTSARHLVVLVSISAHLQIKHEHLECVCERSIPTDDKIPLENYELNCSISKVEPETQDSSSSLHDYLSWPSSQQLQLFN